MGFLPFCLFNLISFDVLFKSAFREFKIDMLELLYCYSFTFVQRSLSKFTSKFITETTVKSKLGRDGTTPIRTQHSQPYKNLKISLY